MSYDTLVCVTSILFFMCIIFLFAWLNELRIGRVNDKKHKREIEGIEKAHLDALESSRQDYVDGLNARRMTGYNEGIQDSFVSIEKNDGKWYGNYKACIDPFTRFRHDYYIRYRWNLRDKKNTEQVLLALSSPSEYARIIGCGSSTTEDSSSVQEVKS